MRDSEVYCGKMKALRQRPRAAPYDPLASAANDMKSKDNSEDAASIAAGLLDNEDIKTNTQAHIVNEKLDWIRTLVWTG